MGLFDSLFGSNSGQTRNVKNEVPWIPLVSVGQLEEIVQLSDQKTQIIFKHSTTCGISRMVMNTFENAYDFAKDQVDLYFLDLHGFREVSNETAIRFQIQHQSPQLLIIKEGKLIAHSSHGGITDIDIKEYV